MQLRALSVAEGLPARFDARVHSVFRHAFNLELREGRIVPVVTGRHAPVGGVQLPVGAVADFAAWTAPDTAAACRGGVLRVGTALAIDLRGAEISRSAVPAFSWRDAGAAGENAWRVAWCVFQTAPVHFASAALRRELGQLFRAHRDGDAGKSAVNALIGLGPGLTPSGDDALVGWLCALAALEGSDERMTGLRPGAAECVVANAHRTTAISRHYLIQAAQGAVGPHLTALVGAVGAGDAEMTRAAMDEALAVGATSGADGVLGLLAGLAAGHPAPSWLLPSSWFDRSAAA